MPTPCKTAVNMGTTFSGTLKVSHEGYENGGSWTTNSPLNRISATFFGVTCSILGGGWDGPNKFYTAAGRLVSTSPNMYMWDYAIYYKYTITVPYSTAVVYCLVSEYSTGPTPMPVPMPPAGLVALPAGAVIVDDPIEVPFEYTVSGVWIGTEVTNRIITGEEVCRDYTDRTLEAGWFADADSSVVVTAAVPGVGTLTSPGEIMGYSDLDAVDTDPFNLAGQFHCAWQIILNYAPVIDTPLATIGLPKYSDAFISLAALPLHNPGTGESPPIQYTTGFSYSPPASGAYWRIFDDAGIAIERCVTATTSGLTWNGRTSVPYLISVVFNNGAFNDDPENSLAITYDCGAVDYIGDAYVPHLFTGSEDRHEFYSCWDRAGYLKWDTRAFSANIDEDWATANGEVIEDSAAGIKVYPINSSNWNAAALSDLLWPMIEVSLADSIDINDPVDAPSRPSDWEAVSGCTVAGDVWTVGIGANNPQVKRVFETTDFNRLPIVAPPYEDEWHWAQYAYLLVGLTAAKAGTIVMTVKFLGWNGSSYSSVVNYNMSVAAGANLIQVDLCCPNEGGIPKLFHVDEVWFTLPDGGATTEEYTLTSLALTKDTVSESALFFRSVRGARWYEGYGFGIGAVVDGKDALWVGDTPAYLAQWNNEKKLSYFEINVLGQAPNFAKTLEDMCEEIGWQRGWTASYDIASDSPYNVDADNNKQSLTFYSWDLKECYENSDTVRNGATTVGVFNLLPGTPIRIHVEKYLRGRIHGIAKNTAGNARVRSTVGAVIATGSNSVTHDTYAETLDTDAQGWFRSAPLQELDWTYRAGINTGLTIVNREYTTASAYKGSHKQPDNTEGNITDIHIAFADEDNGNIYIQRKGTAKMDWESPRNIGQGTYPYINIKPNNEMILCKQTGANTIVWQKSTDGGFTFNGVGSPVTGKYPIATEYNGIQYLVCYTSNVGQVVRRSQNYFSTLMTFGTATSALITASTDAERAAFLKAESDANSLCVVVPYAGNLTVFRSVNDGETWTS